MTLFDKPGDYEAFEAVLDEALERVAGVKLLSYCLMPNHWHLVLRPSEDGELATLMQWLTLTHTRRWQEHRHCHGSGHVYQGRFKSFPVQTDRHFLTVCRYVERNAMRAGLVERGEDWQWSSLWIRREADAEQRARLGAWPVEGGVPGHWLRTVNTPMKPAELDAVRLCVGRGRPFGSDPWTRGTAERLGLEHSFRPRGRPRKTIE